MYRHSITSHEAFVLLDWLDKVRICLWLHQIIMQRTTETIDPHLHVGNRIGTKDRLLHLYTLDGKGKGLNAFGIESLIRSEEHTSELQSLMRISYAVLCLQKKNSKYISD